MRDIDACSHQQVYPTKGPIKAGLGYLADIKKGYSKRINISLISD